MSREKKSEIQMLAGLVSSVGSEGESVVCLASFFGGCWQLLVVLITFLIAETKYPTPGIKRGKIYLAQFVEVSIGSLQHRVNGRETVHGKPGQASGSKQQVTAAALSVPYVASRLLTPGAGSTHTRVDLPVPHSQNYVKLISV